MHRRILISLFLLHLLLGGLFFFFPFITKFYGITIIAYGILNTIKSANRNNEAFLWSAYWVGMEVFLRMTEGYITWEFGKYGIILLFLVGMIVDKRNIRISGWLIFVLLLFLPSLAVVEFANFEEGRRLMAQNLSGPVTLVISAIYFFNRKLEPKIFFKSLRLLLYPMVVMLVYLVLASPDLDSIQFGAESNFAASAGYGPNQVSVALGFAIICLFIIVYYKQSFSGYRILDFSIGFLFIFRGLLTFSL